MDTDILKRTLTHYDQYFKGTITAKSMFGGFGIFHEGAMFALLFQDHLFIREAEQIKNDLKRLGCTPYTYKKKGFLTTTKYFLLPDDMDDKYRDQLMYQSWLSSYEKKQEEPIKSKARIKDLANLGLKYERMLKKIGITCPQELEQIGAVDTYNALKNEISPTLSKDTLLKLHGAIQGVHWSTIPEPTRQALLIDTQM